MNTAYKFGYKTTLIVGLLLLSVTGLRAQESFEWPGVLARGGLKILAPVQIDTNTWFVPIRFDASGRRKVAVEPSYLDSFATVARIEMRVTEGKLYIALLRSTVTNPGSSRVAYGAYVDGCSGKKLDAIFVSNGSEVSIGTVDFSEIAYPTIGSQTAPPKVPQ